jgi:hypothetical protein
MIFPMPSPEQRGRLPRRTVISAIPVIPAAAAVLGSCGCTSPPAAGVRVPRFFTSHQAAVVRDATARIAPGPRDDPAEAGHPGAREAGVADYIDIMLGALGALDGDQDPPPVIFAGGPWSNRHAPGRDPMEAFLRLDPVARIAWRRRLADWRRRYTRGIAALDRMAGGDFTRAAPTYQDKILARREMGAFTSLLFEHTIEGMYANPEYGGNRGLAGWKDIGFPGDIQPRGYSAQEVERSDGPDPVPGTPIVADVLKLLGAL